MLSTTMSHSISTCEPLLVPPDLTIMVDQDTSPFIVEQDSGAQRPPANPGVQRRGVLQIICQQSHSPLKNEGNVPPVLDLGRFYR